MSLINKINENLNEKTSILIISLLIIVTTTLIILGSRYTLNKTSKNNKLQDKEILKKVYEDGNGNNWDIKYKENWNNDDTKLSEWNGVETGFSNGQEHVLELIMRGNRNFTGNYYLLYIIYFNLLILNYLFYLITRFIS